MFVKIMLCNLLIEDICWRSCHYLKHHLYFNGVNIIFVKLLVLTVLFITFLFCSFVEFYVLIFFKLDSGKWW
jgi:hypothetical protein